MDVNCTTLFPSNNDSLTADFSLVVSQSTRGVVGMVSDELLLAETSYLGRRTDAPNFVAQGIRVCRADKLSFASCNSFRPLNLGNVFLTELQHSSLKFANARRTYAPLSHGVAVLFAFDRLL